MLKNKSIYSTLRVISLEHVPLEENVKCNDAKKDEVDDKEDTWIMVTKKATCQRGNKNEYVWTKK